MPGRLATTLAARGAGSPDAFAAFLSSRARGGQRVLGFAGGGGLDDEGSVMTCPNCGYTGRDFKGGASGADVNGEKDALRTPAPSTGYTRSGAPLTVRGPSNSGPGLATPTAGGISLASPRVPVTSPSDVLVTRRPEGGASIRHRRGGIEIGSIISGDKGWQAVYGGKEQRGHPHQRAALAELISLWNTGTASLERPADAGLQPQATQTPLMQQFGVPAINALATPSTGYSDGPRTTSSSASDDDSDDNSGSSGGLTPKGQGIYKKLKAKGWPDAKAMMFAKRAQSFGGSK